MVKKLQKAGSATKADKSLLKESEFQSGDGEAIIRVTTDDSPYIPVEKTIKKTKLKSRKQRVRQEKAIAKGIAAADVVTNRFVKNEERVAKKLRWKKIY